MERSVADVGEVSGAEHLDQADRDAPDDRTDERVETSDDDGGHGTERGGRHLVVDVARKRPQKNRCSDGQEAGHRPGKSERQTDVDPLGQGGLVTGGRGPHRESGASSLEQRPQRQHQKT